MSRLLETGSRLRIHQYFGTIRYIGPVQNHEGTWVGVEWDDPQRGKHDGTVGGVSYFKTSCPTSGSMIRIEKLAETEALSTAIYNKYTNDEDFKLDDEMLKDAQKQMRAAVFEVVGMEKIGKKQSNLSHLVDVSVANSMTNRSGDLEMFKNLTSLDISSTLIWNWKIVAEIIAQLPTLVEINLSNNRLQTPTDDEIVKFEPEFKSLRKLNLGNCKIYSWKMLVHLAKMWPFIETLYLESNEIESIPDVSYDGVFKHLRTLDLQNNSVFDKESLSNLGKIVSLETLFLMNNKIVKLEFTDCDYTEKVDVFNNLKSINLRDNPFEDDCTTYNELDKLPSLESLSIDPNSAFGFEETLSRAVGLISGLKTFNRAKVLDNLRRDSECDIWKKYAIEWTYLRNEEQKSDFLKRHRVYARIIQRFGDPAQCLPDTKKKSSMINLRLFNSKTGETKDKKVPKRINLQTLQNLIAKLFPSNSTSELKMSVLDRERNVEIILDNYNKSLDFYSIEDNDTIVFET